MRKVSTLLVALAAVFTISSAASATQLNCLREVSFKTSTVTANTTTSSTTPVNVTGAVAQNVIGNSSCVRVEFTGQFQAPNGARVSLLITGINPAPTVLPATLDIYTTGTGLDQKTLTFVIPKVACSCTIQVRVQSLKAGSAIVSGRGILRVFYNDDT